MLLLMAIVLSLLACAGPSLRTKYTPEQDRRQKEQEREQPPRQRKAFLGSLIDTLRLITSHNINNVMAESYPSMEKHNLEMASGAEQGGNSMEQHSIMDPRNPSHFFINTIRETDEYYARFPLVAQQNASENQPFVAETLFHNGRRPFSEVFFPKGIPISDEKQSNFTNLNDLDRSYWIWQNTSEAVCELRSFAFYTEMPHNFQQLIRCFSWWHLEQNKNKQKVLCIDKYGRPNGKTDGMKFIHDMYTAMKDVFGVRLDIGSRPYENGTVVWVDVPWKDPTHLINAYGMFWMQGA